MTYFCRTMSKQLRLVSCGSHCKRENRSGVASSKSTRYSKFLLVLRQLYCDENKVCRSLVLFFNHLMTCLLQLTIRTIVCFVFSLESYVREQIIVAITLIFKRSMLEEKRFESDKLFNDVGQMISSGDPALVFLIFILPLCPWRHLIFYFFSCSSR